MATKTEETKNDTATKTSGTETTKEVRVSGDLTKDTVNQLQKKLGVKQTGVLDKTTWAAVQELANVEADGYMLNQVRLLEAVPSHSNIDQAVWRFTGLFADNPGDPAIRFVQDKLSLPVDGQFTSEFVRGLQKWLNEGGDLV